MSFFEQYVRHLEPVLLKDFVICQNTVIIKQQIKKLKNGYPKKKENIRVCKIFPKFLKMPDSCPDLLVSGENLRLDRKLHRVMEQFCGNCFWVVWGVGSWAVEILQKQQTFQWH